MAESDTTARTATVDQGALEAWGRGVGEAARGGAAGGGSLSLPLVIVLRGPLGAGKSVLARAIARGAGVESPMPSPTYNLLFGYDGDGVRVHHLDLYRLEDPDDVWELGWEELGQGREVVLIEWPERAEELLPEDRWEIRLGPAPEAGHVAPDPALRTVRVQARGRASRPPPLPEAEG